MNNKIEINFSIFCFIRYYYFFFNFCNILIIIDYKIYSFVKRSLERYFEKYLSKVQRKYTYTILIIYVPHLSDCNLYSFNKKNLNTQYKIFKDIPTEREFILV